ncbi:hypothetical protein L2E82_36657 [Cichorium intybus]|uniref:Uncharacterized protein n=1 Tax=Cichorium intybus TaxID=13427 RepID=A0ACB9ACS6_CICIN|nr:hypothetical protein L2E82_36657 [Cichorium intybus]
MTHPRDDLSGMDVARKGLILARLLGLRMDMDSIKIGSLYPDKMSPNKMSLKDFLANGLPLLDNDIEERIKKASSNGNVLRYVCVIENSRYLSIPFFTYSIFIIRGKEGQHTAWKQTGARADWWSVGVILFELLVGIPPFNAESPQQVFGNIMNRDIPWPKIPKEMSFEAYDLINNLLTENPVRARWELKTKALTDFGLSKIGLINSTDDLTRPDSKEDNVSNGQNVDQEWSVDTRERSAVGTPDYLALKYFLELNMVMLLIGSQLELFYSNY